MQNRDSEYAEKITKMKSNLTKKIASHDFEMKEITSVLENLNTNMQSYTIEYETAKRQMEEMQTLVAYNSTNKQDKTEADEFRLNVNKKSEYLR